MSAVLASLFIVFIVYEQCEEEIDSIVALLLLSKSSG
jgi:hypothetical protein